MQDTPGLFDRRRVQLEALVGGSVHLVKVIGQRWSYVAGDITSDFQVSPPQRILLDQGWGLLVWPEAGRQLDEDALREMMR